MIIEIIQETEGVTIELTPMSAVEEEIVRSASVYAKALDLDLVWWGDTEPPNPENEDEILYTQGIKIHVKPIRDPTKPDEGAHRIILEKRGGRFPWQQDLARKEAS